MPIKVGVGSPGGSTFVYRISYVRMYYCPLPKRDTPTPFAEFRVFVYLKKKPAFIMEKALEGKMLNALDDMINNIFGSITDAEMQNAATFDRDVRVVEWIDAKTRVGGLINQMKIEIDGMEGEKIDVLEAQSIVNDEEKKVKLFHTPPLGGIKINDIYRYAAFWTPYGDIKYAKDERGIRELEMKLGRRKMP
jgi:hypothetical protein